MWQGRRAPWWGCDEAGRVAAFPEIIGGELRRILGVDAGGAAIAAVERVQARVGRHPHGVNVVAQTSSFIGRDEVGSVGDAKVVAPLVVGRSLAEAAPGGKRQVGAVRSWVSGRRR